MLVELGLVELRYQAVLEVLQQGVTVTANRLKAAGAQTLTLRRAGVHGSECSAQRSRHRSLSGSAPALWHGQVLAPPP